MTKASLSSDNSIKESEAVTFQQLLLREKTSKLAPICRL